MWKWQMELLLISVWETWSIFRVWWMFRAFSLLVVTSVAVSPIWLELATTAVLLSLSTWSGKQKEQREWHYSPGGTERKNSCLEHGLLSYNTLPKPRGRNWTYDFNNCWFLDAKVDCERNLQSTHSLLFELGCVPPVWMVNPITNHWPPIHDSRGWRGEGWEPGCQAQRQRSWQGLPRAGGSFQCQQRCSLVLPLLPTPAQHWALPVGLPGGATPWLVGGAVMTTCCTFPQAPHVEMASVPSLHPHQDLFQAPSHSELGSSDSTTAAHPPWDAKGLCEHKKGMHIPCRNSHPSIIFTTWLN